MRWRDLLCPLDKLLKTIKIRNLRYPGTNFTYEQILKMELHRFKDILQSHINSYYSSYHPHIYERGKHGGNLRKSIKVDEICKLSSKDKLITCRVLINENAIHDSVATGKKANAFWLINDGWKVKKEVPFKGIYRFGYYEGAHFVEDAIAEFQKTNPYGIKIEVIRPLLYY